MLVCVHSVRFLELPEATSLAAANKRIANILRKSDNVTIGEVDATVLKEACRSPPVRFDA